MIYRIYTERKPEFAQQAAVLKAEINELLGIRSIGRIRVLTRYDVEGIDSALFDKCVDTVFAEPQTDDHYDKLPEGADRVFATEYLPGQFDQRADSCAQCIQFVSGSERPLVRTAAVYLIYGDPTEQELAAVKRYVINPVESREASLDMPKTLAADYAVPDDIRVIDGFVEIADRAEFIKSYGLAMDENDLAFCQEYFSGEGRCPTMTELRMIDTYWSDHCRHTTFSTVLDSITSDDPRVMQAYERYLECRSELNIKKPVTLMDMATIGGKYLRKKGLLEKLDVSEEINACTVRTQIEVDGSAQDWLVLFKNETHNHPTEIEPFGGAATCIGGAIRDPLSGRAYVYQAMRVTGAADPTVPMSATMPGKLPQRKLTTSAAAGYSSYGNQIGLATGLVDELYHPGYAAKRMEIGAVVGAAPAANVRREVPEPGDIVVLLGGRTGRDGCGGATGSSKSHDLSSLQSCGAEVQKGNAPEERKLQRLFRNKRAAGMIKRCNDFGAGGVSVAIGELADGLAIDLDKVPKKYEGLDGTELAISESQERMAVVLSPEDVDAFMSLADAENLEATVVATVTQSPRLTMKWRGATIVDISREFLNSNGAPRHATVRVEAPKYTSAYKPDEFADGLMAAMADLNVCSKRGLSERFDSTIGAGSVLMPFGGKYQRTPAQAMAAKLPAAGETDACTVFSYGFDPYASEADTFGAAYNAVVSSLAKLTAAGAWGDEIYLTFQEYFERLRDVPERWGKPVAALLGALTAQLDFGIAAIGGKDSMSGSFEDMDVPPTLVSFAISVSRTGNIITPEFKRAGSRVVLVRPSNGQKHMFDEVTALMRQGRVLAASVVAQGGAAAAVAKMCMGNRIGFKFDCELTAAALFEPMPGCLLLELCGDGFGRTIGYTTEKYAIERSPETAIDMAEVEAAYESRLETVFPCNIPTPEGDVPTISCRSHAHGKCRFTAAKPRVLIPVFPGTNCEYDTAAAFEKAGAEARIFVINNLTPQGVAESVSGMARLVDESQIVMLPGGFSGGDEPDGSGKFITAFLRNPELTDAIHALLTERDGLMGGICNGFQALVKLGLLPFGRITDIDADCPTLTYNDIGRHQSKLVRTRVASNLSPWLMSCKVGDIHTVAVSHGEGKFTCRDELLEQLAAAGQIATQYVDMEGDPTMDVQYNPNGSVWAVEGITSPDGRIFGKMGHSERTGAGLYINAGGPCDNGMFANAVKYFK